MASEQQGIDLLGPIIREAARRPWIPLLCYLLAVIGAYAHWKSAKPLYSTSFKVRYLATEDRGAQFEGLVNPSTFRSSAGFNSQTYVLKSQDVIWDALRRIGELDGDTPNPTWERIAKNYSSRIRVALESQAEIISVSYSSSDSENAVSFLNALLQAYVDFDNRTLATDDTGVRFTIQEAIDATDVELKKLRNELETAESELQAYNDAVASQEALEAYATEVFHFLQDARTQHHDALRERDSERQRIEREFELSTNRLGEDHPEYARAVAMRRATTTAFETESLWELPKLSGLVTDEVLQVQEAYLHASERLTDAQKRLADLLEMSETVASAHDVLAEEHVLAKAMFLEEEWKAPTLQRPVWPTTNLEALQRGETRLISRYQRLEDSLAQLETGLPTAQTGEGRVRVLDRSFAAQQTSSASGELALAIAALGGTLLSAAVLGFLSSRRRGFRSLEEMEEAIPEGVVALLPFVRDQVPGPMLLEKGRRPAWDDRFRQLTYRLLTIFAGEERFRFTVCSALPSEGKTTVAANIALTLGRAGRKVLIVDGNMRRPSCSLTLGVNPELTGFFHVLTGQASVDEAVHATQHENVSVVPPGKRADDSTEYLSKAPLEAIFNQMSEKFDVVLFDTPPAMLVADAMITSSHTDGLLLVHAVGSSSRGDLMRVLRQARDADIPVIGVVANQRTKGTFAAPRQDFGYVGSAGKSSSLYVTGAEAARDSDQGSRNTTS